MATSKVIFSYTAGETLTLGAMSLTGDAYLYTTSAVSESPANSGLYTGTFTESSALSGALRIVVLRSSVGVASYQARWTGSDGETVAATELIDVSQVATSASIAALNDFNPASDAVANVTLCATTTTNSDMRGTDSAALASALTVVDAVCDSILVDTGTTLVAQISGLNNFNPASDTVANVTLCATTTTNTDMVAQPDNASIAAIKAKSDQLVFTVANQVDSNALSGGGSGLDAAGVRSAVGLSAANLDTQLGGIPTVSEFEARTIAAASYFDPASDTVANVTLCATTTTNTDMVAQPDNASISAILVDTSQTLPAQIAALSGGTAAYVLPISTSDPYAPRGTALTAFVAGAATFVLEFKDASGAIIDPLSEALYFVVEDASTGTDMVVIADGSLTKTKTSITFTVPASDNTPIGSYRWAVRTETNEKVLGYGVYNIQYAAQDDTP